MSNEKNGDRVTDTATNMEQAVSDALLGTEEVQRFDTWNGEGCDQGGADLGCGDSEVPEPYTTKNQEKECSACGVSYPITNFYKNKQGKNGRRSRCRSCCNAETRAWRKQLNKDEARKKKKEWELSNPESYFLSRAKRLAKLAGVDFGLEHGDIGIPKICPLLGVEIDYKEKGVRSDCSPSVDRIIPNLGYVKGNVRIICELANRIKTNATPDQIKTLARNIDEYSKSAFSLSQEKAG